MADSTNVTTSTGVPLVTPNAAPVPPVSPVPTAGTAPVTSPAQAPPPPTPESTQTTLHEGTAPRTDATSTSPTTTSEKPRGIFSGLHFGPRAIAALHSAYVTATAVASGLIISAVEQGGARDIHGILAYAGHNWLQAVVPMVVAPAYRAARVNTQTAQVVAAGQNEHAS